MQHTDKYKFNIIDPSDDFSPDTLNDNAKKLEKALLEHQSETDAALSQHKSETNAALAAHEFAMNTRVSAVEAAVDAGARFVKLGDGTDGTAGQTITFDLSKVDMNDYAALLLFGSAYGADSTSTLAVSASDKGTSDLIRLFSQDRKSGKIETSKNRGGRKMKQNTLSDMEYSSRKKKTKREEFLEIMDGIIPWEEWVSIIRPYYPTGKHGRPPIELELILLFQKRIGKMKVIR